MGWLHVPRLQGASVYLWARRFQALEWLGGPCAPDPVCSTGAGHAVAQEGLFHRSWPSSCSCSRPRPSPWPRPSSSTSCPSRYSWSQLSRILLTFLPNPSHSLPHAADSACPLCLNLTTANAACAQWGVPCMFQWRIKAVWPRFCWWCYICKSWWKWL